MYRRYLVDYKHWGYSMINEINRKRLLRKKNT